MSIASSGLTYASVSRSKTKHGTRAARMYANFATWRLSSIEDYRQAEAPIAPLPCTLASPTMLGDALTGLSHIRTTNACLYRA